MAFSPPIFGFNDPFDDTDIFEFVYSDPQYIEPSVIDDISTNVGSDLGVPALTLGLTPTQSIRSQNSPSQYFPEDLDFRFELDPSRLNEGQEGLGFMPEKREKSSDFRHIGENPVILAQEPLSTLPQRLCLDDTAIGQSPQSSLLQADSPSQPTPAPIKRGRRNPLPGLKRAKTASMRKIKACSWCHIHKVECNEGTPCDRCRNIFPAYPTACDRARLIEIRFPDYFRSRSIWLDKWQFAGDQRTTAVAFDQTLGAPSDLALTLPTYVANTINYPSQTQGFCDPPIARFGVLPMTASGNWLGTFGSPWTPGSLVVNEPEPAADELPVWAERQLSIELESYKGTSFPAAVGALLLAYRDTCLPAPGPAPASGKKRKQASVVNTRALVGKVLEMQCRFRMWRDPTRYCRAQGRQAAGMSNGTAITALIDCEENILRDLDDLDTKLTLEDELPVWACLWQMILTYRDLIGMYSGAGHGSSSSANLGFNTGMGDVPTALATVEHIHRLLVIKHAAYVGSSSPIFHKRGQVETGQLLAGDERLQSEWENVLLQRKEFYRTFSDKAPSDAFLKTLIIDVEAVIERRRKRNRR